MTCGKLATGGCDNPELSHEGPCLNLKNWDIPIIICREWTPDKATKVFRVDLRGGKYGSGWGNDVFIYVGTETTSPSYAFRHARDRYSTKYFLGNNASQVRKFICERHDIWPEVKLIHNQAGWNKTRLEMQSIYNTYGRYDPIRYVDGKYTISEESFIRGVGRMPEVGDRFTLDVQTNMITITPKESSMPRLTDPIEARVEDLRARAEALMLEAQRLESRPKEPTPDENGQAVIVWTMTFNGGSKVYNYAATRSDDGKWYTTGPHSPKGYAWSSLIDWIYQTGGDDVEVWVPVEYEALD